MASYKVAAPDEYLAITGMGIKTVKITKTAWVLPYLQRCMRFSVQPHDYAMNLQAMTKEKLQFQIPVVFTIGPDVNRRGANATGSGAAASGLSARGGRGGGGGGGGGDDDHESVLLPLTEAANPGLVAQDSSREDRGDSLMKYAMLLADSQGSRQRGGGGGANTHQFLENIVRGIIEGETRVLVSSMTMEEIFTEREVFKRRIFRNIQGELSQFGLRIYNCNVKELKDGPNSVYFESLSRKAHESAANQAKVDIAEAQLRGNVGEAKRKGEQEREIAKINAETVVQRTERDIERATAESTLATRKTALNRDVEIARIEATRATQAKDEDLKRDVEVRRAAAEMERLRASDVVKATIARESKQQAADAAAYEVEAQARANFEKSRQAADAAAYKTKLDAEASALADFSRTTKSSDAVAYRTRVEADARAYDVEAAARADLERAKQASAAAVQMAEAGLQQKLREAEGLSAMADAYAKLGQAFGGPAGLLQYVMIERGTFVELARANADAVRGLQPKISVWNTGPEAGSSAAGAEGAAAGVGGGGGGSSVNTMRNIYQMLPPLMTTINEQTGISLPEWQFGRLAGQMSQVERGEAKAAAVANGSK